MNLHLARRQLWALEHALKDAQGLRERISLEQQIRILRAEIAGLESADSAQGGTK